MAPPPAALKPIPRGQYEINPKTLKVLTAGWFGFDPRAGEAHWLWTASWYFGFLLEPAARNATLRLNVIKARLPDWAKTIDIDVFIDGVAHRIGLGPDTRVLDIPLFDAGRDSAEPVLVEVFLPDARRVLPKDGSDDSRLLMLNLGGIEVIDIPVPHVLPAQKILGLTDKEFVILAYETVLGKQPDKDGLAHYATVLAQGTGRREVLAAMSQTPDSRYPQGVVLG